MRCFDAATSGARGPLLEGFSPTQHAQFYWQDNIAFACNRTQEGGYSGRTHVSNVAARGCIPASVSVIRRLVIICDAKMIADSIVYLRKCELDQLGRDRFVLVYVAGYFVNQIPQGSNVAWIVKLTEQIGR